MATTTPVTDAEGYLRATLADVAAFRSWCGAADQAAALARIHIDATTAPADSQNEEYTDAELAALIPYALIATDPDGGYRMRAAGINADNSTNWIDSGRLVLELIQLVPAQQARNIAAAEAAWKQDLGKILVGLWTLAGKAGYLAITAIHLAALYRIDDDDKASLGDQQGATLTIDWGED